MAAEREVHDARQCRAGEGPYLLHDVAQAVVIDALHKLPRAVGRQERPRGDAAPGHVQHLDQNNG